MTREENLYWLNKEIELWGNECQSKHPIKEALYAARKALEQGPCEDTISRQAAIHVASGYCHPANIAAELAKLPPEQTDRKKGYWIESHEHTYIGNGVKEWTNWYCSECDAPNDKPTDFCPNCGAKMEKSEEESD